jgi:hypothetical protein
VLLTVLIELGCAARPSSPAHTSASTAAPPATIRFVDVRGGKPPMLLYTLKLDLVNARDTPVWILLAPGDSRLPQGDRLVPEGEGGIEMGAAELSKAERVPYAKDVTSRCVEFFNIAPDLVAYRLAARGELHLSDWGLEAWQPIRECHVWQAKKLLVNGRTPLEDWVAARVLAPEGHYVTHTNANDDSASPGDVRHGAAALDVDRVDFVTLDGVQRWTVPIKDIEAARDPG